MIQDAILSLPILSQSFIPLPGGILFLYIVPSITFEPSTCTSQGITLDICPIKTLLLKVVECARSCRITVLGIIPSLMWLANLVQCI